MYRSSRPEVFYKKGVPENFTEFTTKGLRLATLLKKRLWHKCFPANYMKFLRTPFFIEHCWWLLLHMVLVQVHWNYLHVIRENSRRKYSIQCYESIEKTGNQSSFKFISLDSHTISQICSLKQTFHLQFNKKKMVFKYNYNI